MKVAIASYEVYPFAKVGGLADVVGSLPKALKNLEEIEEIIVIMPKHKVVDRNAEKFGYELEKIAENVDAEVIDDVHREFDVYRTFIPSTDVPVYMVSNNHFFSSEKIYEGADPAKPEIFFSAAVLYTLKALDYRPDILHVNDWHTALIPVYLRSVFRDNDFFKKTATVLTIHNIGAPYQGRVDRSYMDFAGLPEYLFNIDGLEFYGQINILKGGILFSDVINTVSPTYAQEIQTEEYGNGLEGVLKLRSSDLYGILNGIDYDEYDPAKDDRIYVNYDINSIDKKYENKVKLQEEVGLRVSKDIPLVGMISRLVDQKGLDLVADIMEYALMLGIQFVVLGTGDPKYEALFKELAQKYPGTVSANIKFDIVLAQRIYAGSDMFLMPSRYEPCGLGQMFSMRYGTIPVVRYTGGLADSVEEYDPVSGTGTGFGFKPYDSAHLLKALARAVYFYKNPESWRKIIVNAMTQDFSWNRSAREYVKLYKSALEKIGF